MTGAEKFFNNGNMPVVGAYSPTMNTSSINFSNMPVGNLADKGAITSKHRQTLNKDNGRNQFFNASPMSRTHRGMQSALKSESFYESDFSQTMRGGIYLLANQQMKQQVNHQMVGSPVKSPNNKNKKSAKKTVSRSKKKKQHNNLQKINESEAITEDNLTLPPSKQGKEIVHMVRKVPDNFDKSP